MYSFAPPGHAPQRRVPRVLRYAVGALCAGATTLMAAPPAPPASTSYRIIQLAPPTFSNPAINASGQVAFTEYFAPGITRARLYDGNQVIDLGSLGGNSTAVAINDRGQVTGQSYLAPGGTVYQAYRWSRRIGMVNLSRPGVTASTGTAINAKGQVAGNAFFVDDAPGIRAFRWSSATGMVNLGSLNTRSVANAMNDAGTVAGDSEAAPPFGAQERVPVRWTQGGPLEPLNPFRFRFSNAAAINAAGHIVGFADVAPSGNGEAFLWTPQAGITSLGVPGESYPLRISDKGVVVGFTLFGPSVNNGFIWSRQNGVVLLGSRDSGRVRANDVNKHGQVVGEFDSRAYLWTRAGGVVDLNTRLVGAPAGFQLASASRINDNGAIVANANTGLVLLVPHAGTTAPPVAGPISVTGSPRIDALLTLSANFQDADAGENHTASWSWGDGSSDVGVVSASQGGGSVSGQHAWRAGGIYTVKLTITDSSGKRSTVEKTVVVCASGAVVAGEGSFSSPAVASTGATRAGGTASFSYRSALDPVSRGGPLALVFHAPEIAFQAASFDAMSADQFRVHYQGQGVLNGKPGYRFSFSAVKGAASGDGKNRVRMRIVHAEPGTAAAVVDYDNAIRPDAGAEGAVVALGTAFERGGN